MMTACTALCLRPVTHLCMMTELCCAVKNLCRVRGFVQVVRFFAYVYDLFMMFVDQGFSKLVRSFVLTIIT